METVQPIRNESQIAEMKKALLYYGSKRDEFLFTLGINCGLRISDMLKLKKKDIKDYKLKLKESKTNKLFELPLDHKYKEISEYIQFLDDEDYLFKSKKSDNPISRVQAHRILKKASESIGLKDISNHSMRKTFGYFHYKRTKDIATLMMLFNHSSQGITLRYIGVHQEELSKSFSASFGGL